MGELCKGVRAGVIPLSEPSNDLVVNSLMHYLEQVWRT